MSRTGRSLPHHRHLPMRTVVRPPSSEGEHVSDEDKMVSDEDPMSDDECEHAALGSQEDIVAETQRPSFVPRAHWPRSESER